MASRVQVERKLVARELLMAPIFTAFDLRSPIIRRDTLEISVFPRMGFAYKFFSIEQFFVCIIYTCSDECCCVFHHASLPFLSE